MRILVLGLTPVLVSSQWWVVPRMLFLLYGTMTSAARAIVLYEAPSNCGVVAGMKSGLGCKTHVVVIRPSPSFVGATC